MEKFVIIGVGMVFVGEYWRVLFRDMVVEVFFNVMDDVGIDKVDLFYVGNMVLGLFIE